jgi:hypothetical protein
VLDAPTGRVRESDEIQLAFNVKDACSTDACSGKGCHEVPGPVKVVGIPLVLLIILGPTVLLLVAERRSRRL